MRSTAITTYPSSRRRKLMLAVEAGAFHVCMYACVYACVHWARLPTPWAREAHSLVFIASGLGVLADRPVRHTLKPTLTYV